MSTDNRTKEALPANSLEDTEKPSAGRQHTAAAKQPMGGGDLNVSEWLRWSALRKRRAPAASEGASRRLPQLANLREEALPRQLRLLADWHGSLFCTMRRSEDRNPLLRLRPGIALLFFLRPFDSPARPTAGRQAEK